jgi:hypothetical protein
MKGGIAERWALKPVGEISGDDIHHLVDEVRAVGIPGLRRRRTGSSNSVARMIHGRLSKFFNWCMERRLVKVNPCLGVWRPSAGNARERVLSDNEVPGCGAQQSHWVIHSGQRCAFYS